MLQFTEKTRWVALFVMTTLTLIFGHKSPHLSVTLILLTHSHQVHNQEFIDHGESVWCSVILPTTSMCLDGVIYGKPTVDIE